MIRKKGGTSWTRKLKQELLGEITNKEKHAVQAQISAGHILRMPG